MGNGGGSGASLDWYRLSPPPDLHAHRPWIRREHTLDALACLSLSVLCFSQATRETLIRDDRDFYSRLLLGAPTLVALILNIVALAAVGFLGAQAIRRVRAGWPRLAAVAAAAALLIVLNFVRITYETIGRWTDVSGPPGRLAAVALILAVSLAWPRPVLRAIRRIVLIALPLGVLTLAAALWMFFEAGTGPVWRRADPAPLTAPAPSLRPGGWVVSEASDQPITFVARPPGLDLPELDRLRRESLYADAARPPAGTTEVSMPALITGRSVVAVAPVSSHDLELTFADGKTALWSVHPNVFSRARIAG